MTHTKPVLPAFDEVDHGIRILEEERRRIARDLHDGPAQTLTNISMKLEVLKMMIDSDVEMAKNQVDQLHKKVGSVIREIRHLIYDLRPIAVDEVGLFEATKALCTQLQQNWNVPIEIHVPDSVESKSIAPARQVALYRLIQEILNNMKKHAQAKTITLTVSQENDELRITICDDGVGFDPNHIPAGHYGLLGMKERALYLGGTLEIDSVIGEGSTFVIRVPVRKG
ncbi:sensor histidine kinase [Alicyclobacillus acidiphilus]|uniref:sensor histidine kinase n=1 Tax=Alicyclobacillus acidiphilus TaxID=182455 RepID=UPI000833C7A2|nr:sensor histidine kinase [Alicyclobacillus acidiphilus]